MKLRMAQWALWAAALGMAAGSQAQMPVPYGAPIGVEQARKAAVAAIAEGRKNGWTVGAAVVDTGGNLVYFERIDGTQMGSSTVAIRKAQTSAAFKRPSKAIEDAVAGGRQVLMMLPGALPIEGGLPLVVEGKIVGAIGVSGGTSPQDGQCAKAGVDALAGPPDHAGSK